MNKTLNILLMFILSLPFASTAMAQSDLEYRAEIGAGINMTAYQGDCSDALFGKMNAGGAVMFRALLNPRSALRISAMVTKIEGDVKNSGTVYPDITEGGYTFSHTLGDLSATYEYNFWPYGTGKDYRGAKRFTPFVSIGMGLTYANCKNGTYDYSSGSYEEGQYVPKHESTKNVIACSIPLGVGLKYKLGTRTNLSLDWQMHFAFTDFLDGVKDPYRIASSGMMKNMDSYSTVTLALTYSISPKCSTCHNSDWHY